MPLIVEALEDDLVPVDRHFGRRECRASRRCRRDACVRSMSRSAAALPDISRPTSKPSCMPSCLHRVVERLARDVERQRRAHLACELQAIVVDVGDDDVARADEAHDRRGHDADRPGAGDQHVLADDVERERGVHGVAERIENRGDLIVDRVGQLECVERRE